MWACGHVCMLFVCVRIHGCVCVCVRERVAHIHAMVWCLVFPRLMMWHVCCALYACIRIHVYIYTHTHTHTQTHTHTHRYMHLYLNGHAHVIICLYLTHDTSTGEEEWHSEWHRNERHERVEEAAY